MAIRYGSSFQHGSDPETFGNVPWFVITPISSAAGGIARHEEAHRVYANPAAYSEVRKVVFWASVRQEHTGTALTNVPIRLRVAPSSTSQANRTNIETLVIPESSIVRVEGTGAQWSAVEPNAEAAFYSFASSQGNQPNVQKFGSLTTSGEQLIWYEFDRFAFDSAEFFDDWDTVAANGNLDEFMAFALGIERADGVAWVNTPSSNANFRPVLVACGFAVTQAPTVTNNTRIYLPATQSLTNPGSISGTSFSTIHRAPFFYHADEWDGSFQIRVITRQHQSAAGGTRGNWSIRVNKMTNESTTVSTVYQEQFNDQTTASCDHFARSADFASLLEDGGIYDISMQSDSGGNQDIPWGWWEITHRGFNKTTVFFDAGPTPLLVNGVTTNGIQPAPPPPDAFNKGSSLFDPLWFEDFPADRIIDARVQSALNHVTGLNNTSQNVNLNANLGDPVDTSTFNVIVEPDVSSTPDATVGFRAVDSAITSNDPINLAGKRKLTARLTGTNWLGSTDDECGRTGLAYVINVPNTDVLPLGPLFDLGSFDAEGCAATSAGLGEPPLLIITNGSTIPKKFNPTAAGTDGEVEDAGIPTPFEEEVPTAIAADAASSPNGGLDLGTYRYRYTFRNCCTGKESDPNLEDIVVDTTGQAPAASVTFSFANVRIPGDPQICEICLYRTVEGGDYPVMAKVGCFNVDEGTTFVDDLSDDALDFVNDSLSILNAPMPCVPIVVDFRNRLFGMGDIPNLAPAGTVSVVNGSDIVQGDGSVLWDRCLEGKFIQVGADCRRYEILRVLPPEAGTSPSISRLRLVENYEGTTDTALSYTICGRPNRLYFSEPLEPECWPAAGFIDVEPGDGDRLMGAVSNFDSLLICKRRKTYVLRFRENPGLEVIVPSRISSDIGCIGPRTFAQVESGSVWLADRGLALYDGRSVQHIPESEAMNDIFIDPDNENYVRRDRNGRVIEAVGVFYPKREQYLLLLPTVQTSRGCNLMLVWDVKLRNVTLLKFCQEFLSMVVGKDSEGNERVYLGDTNGFVWIYDIGDTDGVGFPNSTGTVRGTVTGAGLDATTGASYLDDSSALFITGGIPGLADLSGVAGLSGSLGGGDVGLAGACVYTRRSDASYDDPWTVRTIYAATETRLYITPQWGADQPEAGFDYMIGAIELDLLFKPQNYGTDDMSKRDWRQIVVHEIEQFSSQLRIDLLPDFQLADPEADTVVDPVTGDTGEGRVFRMDYERGRQIKPVGRYIHFFMGIRMRNFAPEEPIRVINHLLAMTPRTSK